MRLIRALFFFFFALLLYAATQQATDFLVTPRGTKAGETGRARFYELKANGEHSVDLKAPDSLAASTPYTLPDAYPASNGYSLTSTTGGTLSWTNVAAGGGWTLVEQHTASNSATIDFTSCISSTYDTYVITITDMQPVTDNTNLNLRVSTDGGMTYDSGNNYGWALGAVTNVGFGVTGADTDSTMTVTHQVANSTDWNLNSEIWLFKPGSSDYKMFKVDTVYMNPGNGKINRHIHGGAYKASTAVDAFQFYMSSGNINVGEFRCYGLSK